MSMCRSWPTVSANSRHRGTVTAESAFQDGSEVWVAQMIILFFQEVIIAPAHVLDGPVFIPAAKGDGRKGRIGHQKNGHPVVLRGVGGLVVILEDVMLVDFLRQLVEVGVAQPVSDFLRAGNL